jgi:hypothetical protein
LKQNFDFAIFLENLGLERKSSSKAVKNLTKTKTAFVFKTQKDGSQFGTINCLILAQFNFLKNFQFRVEL